MKPLTCQFATGYSLYYLPHSASVTKLSLRLHIKAHEANISVSTAYLQLGIWKLIIHLEYMHFIHYTYFHAVAMFNLTMLWGYSSGDSSYFNSKIYFLTSGLIYLQYFIFLFNLLLNTQLSVHFFWAVLKLGSSERTQSFVCSFFFWTVTIKKLVF